MHLSRQTLIIIAVAVVVLGAGAYFMWGNQPAQEGTLSVTDNSTGDVEDTFVNLAAHLDSIAFDATILTDPRFMALQDLHTSIVAEAAGRKDPFAPIPGVAAAK